MNAKFGHNESTIPTVNATLFFYGSTPCIVHEGAMYELKAFTSLPTVKMWLARIGGVDHVVVPTVPPEKIFSTDPTARLTHAVALLAHRVETLSDELKSATRSSNVENALESTNLQLGSALEALRVSDELRESQAMEYEREIENLRAQLKEAEESIHSLESQLNRSCDRAQNVQTPQQHFSSASASSSTPTHPVSQKTSSHVTEDQVAYLTKQGAYRKNGVYGGDAAIVAARMGRVDILKALYADGISMEERNEYGEMTAHVAAKEDQLEVLKYLHSLHVPLALCTNNGQTPLDIAISYGRLECQKWLKSHKR